MACVWATMIPLALPPRLTWLMLNVDVFNIIFCTSQSH